MRRALLLATLLLTLAAGAPAAAPGGNAYFAPKNRTIRRASLAGVTPRSSWAAVQRAWSGDPASGPGQSASWGKSVAVWGSPGIFSGFVAWAGWAGGVGERPIRYAVDLGVAEGLGIVLRTRFGDRVGTKVRTFRRHWPAARVVRREPDASSWSVPSSYRGWRLVFVFRGGVLKHVELARGDFVEACLRRSCPRGFPP